MTFTEDEEQQIAPSVLIQKVHTHDLFVPSPCHASLPLLYGPFLQMQYLYKRYSFSLQYQEEATEAKQPKNKGNFTTQYQDFSLELLLALLLLQWLSWWGQSMHCYKCQRLRECGGTHRYAPSTTGIYKVSDSQDHVRSTSYKEKH